MQKEPQLITSHLSDALPKILAEYLVRTQLSVQEVADAAGVTRAAVYNWLKGADARNSNLLRLIRFYDLNKLSFQDLCPQTADLQREFDPLCLGLLARLEAARTRFKDLIDHRHDPAVMTSRDPAQGFGSAFLKQHGKAIFEAAYRDEKHEGSLILVCTSSGEAQSAREIVNRKVVNSEHHYLSNIDVMKELGIVLEYEVYLSDIIGGFPELERAAKRLFGRAAVLRISVEQDDLQSNEIKLLDFTWESYRGTGFSPVDYLFYWASDLDGRCAFEKVFGAVKNAISQGGKSLTLAVHVGYFRDEVFAIYEDESGDSDDSDDSDDGDCGGAGAEIPYMTRDEIIRNSIPVGTRLDGFLYELGDDSEVAGPSEGVEGVKVFICNADLTANDSFDIPEELPARAFLSLFPILGYKLNIDCDKGGKGVHSAVITW